MNTAEGVGDLDLVRLVSEPRFATYRQYLLDHPELRQGQPVELLAKRLYMWDAAVAAALLPVIAFTEVVLRNAMNDAVCAHFRVSPRQGWYPLVLEPEPRLALLPGHVGEVEREVQRLSRRIRRLPTGDEFVGGSSLGIWAALLDRGDHRDSRFHYDVKIWRAYLASAFPNYRGTRKALRDGVSRMARLRNRVAHHETLLRRNIPGAVEDLCRIISYIDADACDYMLDTEQATAAFRRQRAFLRSDCRK